MSDRPLLRRASAEAPVELSACPLDPDTLRAAEAIVEDVRHGGAPGALRHALRLGDLEPGDPVHLGPRELEAAARRIDPGDLELLRRTAGRIRQFAVAQRACITPLDTPVDGGRAGHDWVPVSNVGAYAPGGRYPLPSSVLMTVVPARVAGVERVVVASPRPSDLVLAAACVAEADGVIAIGGAQAVAAMAFGCWTPPADVVVGPGNRWVTAGKRALVGEVGIDGLAGPSELLVVADSTADAALVAADLIGQAEHDPDAVPVLIATDASLVDEVEQELARQLVDLPNADVARRSLRTNGEAIVATDVAEAIGLANRWAPEHLQLCVADAERWAPEVRNCGGLFLGHGSAEVFGDYGLGPNHVLPTGRGARHQAGLSIFSFLRPRTWLQVDDPEAVRSDVVRLARLEGLEGHARAADLRGRTASGCAGRPQESTSDA